MLDGNEFAPISQTLRLRDSESRRERRCCTKMEGRWRQRLGGGTSLLMTMTTLRSMNYCYSQAFATSIMSRRLLRGGKHISSSAEDPTTRYESGQYKNYIGPRDNAKKIHAQNRYSTVSIGIELY
jgi:hypothetical protein